MKSKKKNPILLIFIAGFILICSALVGFILWWGEIIKPVNPNDENKIQVVVPKGYGVTAIGELLKEKKLIKSTLAFRLLAKRDDLGGKLQAGSFHLSPSQSLSEIASALTTGREDFWVTIPEGKRREEIAGIFVNAYKEQGLNFSTTQFLQASENIEGYLFPDTYLIAKNMTELDLVNLLRHTFDQKIPDEDKIAASTQNLSFQEILILASLVEREAKYQNDRPMVAGILFNRLKIGMALQVDATVQYAQATQNCSQKIGLDCKWWPIIEDTKFKSDYNTYLHSGLPPAPICNPGLFSIKATLNPAKHDYLYYLSEPSGKTYYAKTLKEHEANIVKYLE